MDALTWAQMVQRAYESFEYDDNAESWVDGNPPRGSLHHKIWFNKLNDARAFINHLSSKAYIGFHPFKLEPIVSDDGFEVHVSNIATICSADVTNSAARLIWESRPWGGYHELCFVEPLNSKIMAIQIPRPYITDTDLELSCRFITESQEEVWFAQAVLCKWARHWRIQNLQPRINTYTPDCDEYYIQSSKWLADFILEKNAPDIEVLRWTMSLSPSLQCAAKTMSKTAKFSFESQQSAFIKPPLDDLSMIIKMQSSSLLSSMKNFDEHKNLMSILQVNIEY